MNIVQTDRWLIRLWDDPVKLCAKISGYFSGGSATDIYHYLLMHGMYEHPLKNGEKLIKKLMQKNVWKNVSDEAKRLKNLWNGPEIPIFIFPANLNSAELRESFNGKSGLAFRDKLFLFISEYNSKEDIKALLTHEYNHVCRLSKYKKKEKDYTLLDTIILEGLAENAVHEQLGDEYVAKWTTYYTHSTLEKMWQRLILPSIELSNKHKRHRDLLYGRGFFPKMIGYCVGYHIVKKYIDTHQCRSKDLLSIPSEDIAQISSSN